MTGENSQSRSGQPGQGCLLTGSMTKAKHPKPPHPKRAGPAARTNPTTGGFRISDDLWEVLEPLIPERVNTHRFVGGRPRVPDRTCAIFYVLRTDCQRKALDATGIWSGSTAHLRFQEWVPAGVFLELWRVGLQRYDELQGSGLKLVEHGRRHDQVSPGRWEKPAPTPPTKASAASIVTC